MLIFNIFKRRSLRQKVIRGNQRKIYPKHTLLKNQKLKHILVFFFFGFGCSVPCSAQLSDVYFDLGGTYNTFSNKTHFEVQSPHFTPHFRWGAGLFMSDNQRLRGKVEFGNILRRFGNSYPGFDFVYSFYGFQLSAGTEFQLLDHLFAEAGLGYHLFISIFKENDVFQELGDGFRNSDMVVFAGLNYQVYKPVFIGARFNYGLIPMAMFNPIGNYGEMGKVTRELNLSAAEIFIRIKLYRVDNDL